MTIDRNQYIGLYSVAMEEARHRDRLYTQTWIAVAIAGSVLFAAIGFFLKEPSAISGYCIMWFMIGLGLVLAPLFTYSVFRLVKEGNICRDIASTIEKALLSGREQSEAPELEGLLVRQKIDEIKSKPKCERLKWAFSRREQGWRWVYPITIVVIWIVLSILVSMK